MLKSEKKIVLLQIVALERTKHWCKGEKRSCLAEVINYLQGFTTSVELSANTLLPENKHQMGVKRRPLSGRVFFLLFVEVDLIDHCSIKMSKL